MKINNFRGDLTNVLAKNEALLMTCISQMFWIWNKSKRGMTLFFICCYLHLFSIAS